MNAVKCNQMCTVGIVTQQYTAIRMNRLCNRSDIRLNAVIIRAGDIDDFCLRVCLHTPVDFRSGHRQAKPGFPVVFRHQPVNFRVTVHAGIDKRQMGIAHRNDLLTAFPYSGSHHAEN